MYVWWIGCVQFHQKTAKRSACKARKRICSVIGPWIRCKVKLKEKNRVARVMSFFDAFGYSLVEVHISPYHKINEPMWQRCCFDNFCDSTNTCAPANLFSNRNAHDFATMINGSSSIIPPMEKEKCAHRTMVHGTMVHRTMVHRTMVHGTMVHGTMVRWKSLSTTFVNAMEPVWSRSSP